MISIDLRSHDGLMCPSCGKSVAALVDGMTPGAYECVGCVADEMWPEMFAQLRMLRDEIDAVLRDRAERAAALRERVEDQ